MDGKKVRLTALRGQGPATASASLARDNFQPRHGGAGGSESNADAQGLGGEPLRFAYGLAELLGGSSSEA